MGYRNLAVMAGGAPAWAAAGYELFTGVNVPSKAFGEAVEHRCGTPHIGASELKQRLDVTWPAPQPTQARGRSAER